MIVPLCSAGGREQVQAGAGGQAPQAGQGEGGASQPAAGERGGAAGQPSTFLFKL